MKKARANEIKGLFIRKGPILRSKILKQEGCDSREIQALLATKELIRLKKGYYTTPILLTRLSDAQIAVATVPEAVLYYLSAAEYHQLISVIPTRVYVAVPNKGVVPTKPEFPPVDITRINPDLYSLGKTRIPTMPISITCYNRERTICDLARRRDDVGKDVLIEALRKYLSGERNLQLLYDYAEQLRVHKIIHPYLEALS